MKDPRCQKASAFTLVELLVVIGIIVVLATLLIGGMRTMTNRARSAQCMAKIKNIGAMFNTYASENNDLYPLFVFESGAPRISNPYEEFKQYLGTDSFEVWHCPADPGTGPHNDSLDITKATRSYSMNGYVGAGYSPLRRSGIAKPSRTILVAENWTGFLPTTINGALVDTVYDNIGRGGSGAILHDRSNLSNFAFIDGHVERLTWLQVSPKSIGGHGLFATDEANRDGL